MRINVLGTLQISEKSTGVTQSAGVQSVLTKVIEYQVPAAGYSVMLDADTVLQLKDNGTTETSDGAQVQVLAVKADRMTTSVIEDTSYGLVKKNQDTRIQHHPIVAADKVIVQPFGLIQVWLASNTASAFAVAVQNFNLTAKKVQLTA